MNKSLLPFVFECLFICGRWFLLVFNKDVGTYFDTVARWWISESKNSVLNIFTPAVMWAIWTIRNEMCFQGLKWPGVEVLSRNLLSTIRSWKPLCKKCNSSPLNDNLMMLDDGCGE